jgi:hypothetical protein
MQGYLTPPRSAETGGMIREAVTARKGQASPEAVEPALVE